LTELGRDSSSLIRGEIYTPKQFEGVHSLVQVSTECGSLLKVLEQDIANNLTQNEYERTIIIPMGGMGM